MNVNKAALLTIQHIKATDNFSQFICKPELKEMCYVCSEKGDTPQHAMWLLSEVVNNEDMKNDKANRWLAWAQCLLTVYGFITLEDCKQINKEA